MPTTVLHLFGAGTGGDEHAVATIDIPFDGVIESVKWAMDALLNADGEEILGELSFIATSQWHTHDTRAIISSVVARMGLLTSGGGVFGVNEQHFFDDLRVAGGERVHLHILATAGVTSNVGVDIHLNSSVSTRRSARRT